MAAADANQTFSVFRERGLFRLTFDSAGGGEKIVSAARCISVFIDGLLERWSGGQHGFPYSLIF